MEPLRKRVDFLLANEEIGTIKYQKLRLIKEMLNDPKCFFKISMMDAYHILDDLSYDDQEKHLIYQRLISSNEYNKLLKD